MEFLISRLHNFRETNWIRCVAFHGDGVRFAVCQLNDYIRIYSFGGVIRAPITLKHSRQKNVVDMAWKLVSFFFFLNV